MRRYTVLALALGSLWGCSGGSDGGSTTAGSTAAGSSGATGTDSSSGTSGTSSASSSGASSSGTSGSSGSGGTVGGSSSGSSGSTGSVCQASGDRCGANSPCCSGLGCFNGRCACAANVGDACGNGGAACCGSLTCESGRCQQACATPTPACGLLGDSCGDGGSTCCGSLTCTSGRCDTAVVRAACGTEGDSCGTATDCCGAADAGLRFSCVPRGDGGNFCHLGSLGQVCDPASACLPGLRCVVAVPDAGPADAGPVDAGPIDAGQPVDSGLVDTDAGTPVDAGEADAGAPVDAGEPVDGGDVDAGPLLPGPPDQGTCQPQSASSATCRFTSPTCNVGDSCNYQSDYCGKGGLVCDEATSKCRSPGRGESCTSQCTQTAGARFPLGCGEIVPQVFDSKVCATQCGSDNDCEGATYFDGSNANPPPVSLYCTSGVRGAVGAKVCGPRLCYVGPVGNFPGIGAVSDLYKACAGVPDSVCIPQYWGDISETVGFCQRIRPTSGATVGQACSVTAGHERPDLLCGADAICLGGVCRKMCDAVQGGEGGFPGCSGGLTCQSTQGVNLVSQYQVGGCSSPCNPWAPPAQSGCVNSCGGPAQRCEWLLDDPAAGTAPQGYCGGASAAPIASGQACTPGEGPDPCESGSLCLGASSGTGRCRKLCDLQAARDPVNGCTGSQRCTALFQNGTRAGFCQ